MTGSTYRFSDSMRDVMSNALAQVEGGGDFLGPKPWEYSGKPLTKREYDRLPKKKRPKLFSGYTLGRFQGDAAAGNPLARDAFHDIMGQALAEGRMRPERYQEIMSGLGYIATPQNPIDRHKSFLNQVLQSPEGKKRVAAMDEAILQDDERKVGHLEQAFEERWGRALDPMSLAMLTVWANKFGDLDQTESILTGGARIRLAPYSPVRHERARSWTICRARSSFRKKTAPSAIAIIWRVWQAGSISRSSPIGCCRRRCYPGMFRSSIAGCSPSDLRLE